MMSFGFYYFLLLVHKYFLSPSRPSHLALRYSPRGCCDNEVKRVLVNKKKIESYFYVEKISIYTTTPRPGVWWYYNILYLYTYYLFVLCNQTRKVILKLISTWFYAVYNEKNLLALLYRVYGCLPVDGTSVTQNIFLTMYLF